MSNDPWRIYPKEVNPPTSREVKVYYDTEIIDKTGFPEKRRIIEKVTIPEPVETLEVIQDSYENNNDKFKSYVRNSLVYEDVDTIANYIAVNETESKEQKLELIRMNLAISTKLKEIENIRNWKNTNKSDYNKRKTYFDSLIKHLWNEINTIVEIFIENYFFGNGILLLYRFLSEIQETYGLDTAYFESLLVQVDNFIKSSRLNLDEIQIKRILSCLNALYIGVGDTSLFLTLNDLVVAAVSNSWNKISNKKSEKNRREVIEESFKTNSQLGIYILTLLELNESKDEIIPSTRRVIDYIFSYNAQSRSVALAGQNIVQLDINFGNAINTNQKGRDKLIDNHNVAKRNAELRVRIEETDIEVLITSFIEEFFLQQNGIEQLILAMTELQQGNELNLALLSNFMNEILNRISSLDASQLISSLYNMRANKNILHQNNIEIVTALGTIIDFAWGREAMNPMDNLVKSICENIIDLIWRNANEVYNEASPNLTALYDFVYSIYTTFAPPKVRILSESLIIYLTNSIGWKKIQQEFSSSLKELEMEIKLLFLRIMFSRFGTEFKGDTATVEEVENFVNNILKRELQTRTLEKLVEELETIVSSQGRTYFDKIDVNDQRHFTMALERQLGLTKFFSFYQSLISGLFEDLSTGSSLVQSSHRFFDAELSNDELFRAKAVLASSFNDAYCQEYDVQTLINYLESLSDYDEFINVSKAALGKGKFGKEYRQAVKEGFEDNMQKIKIEQEKGDKPLHFENDPDFQRLGANIYRQIMSYLTAEKILKSRNEVEASIEKNYEIFRKIRDEYDYLIAPNGDRFEDEILKQQYGIEALTIYPNIAERGFIVNLKTDILDYNDKPIEIKIIIDNKGNWTFTNGQKMNIPYFMLCPLQELVYERIEYITSGAAFYRKKKKIVVDINEEGVENFEMIKEMIGTRWHFRGLPWPRFTLESDAAGNHKEEVWEGYRIDQDEENVRFMNTGRSLNTLGERIKIFTFVREQGYNDPAKRKTEPNVIPFDPNRRQDLERMKRRTA